MLKAPDAGTGLELSRFVRPESVPGSPAAGQRAGTANVAFELDDLQAAVDQAAAEGCELVAGVGEYEGPGGWRMSAGRRGSSCRWPSARAEALDTMVIYSMSRLGGRLHHRPRGCVRMDGP